MLWFIPKVSAGTFSEEIAAVGIVGAFLEVINRPSVWFAQYQCERRANASEYVGKM
jgi:hypothetical protein